MAGDGGAAPEGVAEVEVGRAHLPGLEMAEWVIREMVGRHGHVGGAEAANLLMRLRGAIWPARRNAGTVYPTPFDPFAARRAADAGAGDEAKRLRAEMAIWQARFAASECTVRMERRRTHAMAAGRQDWRHAAEVAWREIAVWKTHPQHGQRLKAGVRLAIAWLHARGHAMNDPHAKAVLDCAADNLGKAMSRDASHPEDAVIVAAIGEAMNGAAALRDRLAAAEARAEAAEGERDAARGVLLSLEWSASAQSPYSFGFESYPICPACGGWKPRKGADYALGHAPDCSLAAQLGGTAREGGATCGKSPQVGAAAPTPSRDGGDRGPR